MDYSIIIPTFRHADELKGIIAEVSAVEPDARLIVTSKPASPAHNRNVGLNAATTPYVVMLDDDISNLPPFFARGLVATLLSDPSYAVVSAKLIRPDGRVFMGGRFPKGNAGVDLSLVGWAPSACLAMHRTDLRFDESLPCCEDVDYCFQIAAANPGAKFAVDNDIVVQHNNHETWNRGDAYQVGLQRFKTKWGREVPH